MKIKLEKSCTLAELKPQLEAKFPDYLVKYRGPNVLIVSKGKVAGTMLLVNEKRKFSMVVETFPTIGAQLLFYLIWIIGGIFIPSVIYVFVILRKQRKVRNNVAEFIRSEYGAGPVIK